MSPVKVTYISSKTELKTGTNEESLIIVPAFISQVIQWVIQTLWNSVSKHVERLVGKQKHLKKWNAIGLKWMPNPATSCPARVWELSISFLLPPPLSLPAPSHLSFSSFLSFLSSFLYQFIGTITEIEISVLFFQPFHILSKPLTGLLTIVFPPRGLGNGGFFSHARHQRTHLVQNI